MKKGLIALLAFLLIHHAAPAEDRHLEIKKQEDITYDWLVSYGFETGTTDHIVTFNKIFKLLRIKNMLEFGMGFSTKYFLDNCNKVVSVELVTDGCGPDWMKRCVSLYKDLSNWIPIAYFSGYQGDTNWARFKYLGSDSLAKAAYYQTVNHKSYATINDFYIVEMNSFISNLMKSHKIDLAFVDPGTFIRGDIVQLLFNKVPIIVAHHTSCRANGVKDDVYGYGRIVTPENYEEIFVHKGMGVTVWVIKSDKYKQFAQDLAAYAQPGGV